MLLDNTEISTPDQDRDPGFDAWAMSLDAWLDTPAGLAWLDDQADAAEMQMTTEHFGTRPGLWSTHQ
jgi:hypothetical protein